jgi:hypothetical protein
MRDKISLCVITHNEPKRLDRCLKLFAPAVDEIVVVHATGSAPKDVEIARLCERHGAVYGVYTNQPEHADWAHVDNFAAARQASFDLASNEWCLWVDADDVPGDNFAAALHELLEQHGKEFDGFVLYHNVAGRGIAHNARERLVKRSAGRWVNRIHENFLPHTGDGSQFAQCDAPVVIHLPDDEAKQGNERNLRILESIPEAERTVSVLYHIQGELIGAGRKEEALKMAMELAQREDVAPTERYEILLNVAELVRPPVVQNPSPQYGTMCAALHAAYALQPNRREALALLGALHLDLGDMVRAEAYLRQMVATPRPAKLPWTHRDALYSWGGEQLWTQFLRMTGNTERADQIEIKRLAGAKRPTISVCHPTRARAQQAAATRKRWLDAAAHPDRIEYIFGFSQDEEESAGILSRFRHAASPAGHLEQVGGNAVLNYNAATNAATGQIVVTAQDDVFPPLHWDLMLEQALADKLDQPAILQIKDGYRNDELMVTFCVTRPTFARLGYGQQNILAPEYHGVFSDTEFSLRARRQPFFVPSDIVFKHEHPFWNPAVPSDDTYALENSDDAYKFGNQVFRRRNPDLAPADTTPTA